MSRGYAFNADYTLCATDSDPPPHTVYEIIQIQDDVTTYFFTSPKGYIQLHNLWLLCTTCFNSGYMLVKVSVQVMQVMLYFLCNYFP